MEQHFSKELHTTVPDVERLLELADMFYRLNCAHGFFDFVMNDAKGLHDAKRRLFFLMMALITKQQELLTEANIEHNAYDPFELYNDVLDRFGDDPKANNIRELSYLPQGDSVEQTPVDFDQLTAMVSERLHLNSRLPDEKVPAANKDLKPLPSPQEKDTWVKEVNCFVRNDEAARLVVDSAIYATSNSHLSTCIAHPLIYDYGMDKETLTSPPFCQQLSKMVRYHRAVNAEAIARALLTAANKPHNPSNN
ncbi:MAG: hypothetical protein HUK17_03460 [Bacteroidales bacterium]|nr:hypothetical protein [Bacteroidales bacterium]